MNTQRPGPPYRHHAQHTRWAATPTHPHRGTIRLVLLLAAGAYALGLAFITIGAA